MAHGVALLRILSGLPGQVRQADLHLAGPGRAYRDGIRLDRIGTTEQTLLRGRATREEQPTGRVRVYAIRGINANSSARTDPRQRTGPAAW